MIIYNPCAVIQFMSYPCAVIQFLSYPFNNVIHFLAGHIWRHDDIVAHSDLLWDRKHGHRSRRSPKKTYFDTLCDDTGLTDVAEMQRLMNDRMLWRNTVPARSYYPP